MKNTWISRLRRWLDDLSRSDPKTSAPPTAPERITWSKWLRANGLDELFPVQPGHPFDRLIWEPNPADKDAAWELYTEMRTRITTQRLGYREGDEATALKSVHDIFELTRDCVKQYHGCTHFASLTIDVLNRIVRPFTATWHRRAIAGHLSNADNRFEFRRELAKLQKDLRRFLRLLALLSGDPTFIPETSEPAAAGDLGDSFNFGISGGGCGEIPNLNAREREEVVKRRAYYGLNTDPKDAIGLAFSGGGIRSATFGLGVVQVLANKRILYQVDFLSTVSGGGYLGTFISSFLNDDSGHVSLAPRTGNLPFGEEGDSESQAVRHLRNHSKYLTEGGFWTRSLMASLVLYGVLVSMLLILPLLATGVLVIGALFGEAFKRTPVNAYLPLSPLTDVVLLLLGLMVLSLPLARTLGHNRGAQKVWERASVALALLAAAMLTAEALPQFSSLIGSVQNAIIIATCAVAWPLLWGLVGALLGPKTRGGRAAFALVGVAGPIFAISVSALLIQIFVVRGTPDRTYWLSVSTAALLFYTFFILNINYASPHPFYRNRLARTYMTRRTANPSRIEVRDPQRLSQMNEHGKAPYHLICAALNIPLCKKPDLRGRNTDFFLFSKHYCGSPIINYKPTRDWEAVDAHLDLGTAMAISGAAAAPNMGTLTSSRYTFLLAMLNLRLGYWARRPGSLLGKLRRLLPPPGPYYFARELGGWLSEKTAFVNLSDGGHIENLGIYELIRRKCKFMIAVDGEADPARTFGGLITMIRMAEIDFGVKFNVDLSDLRIDGAGLSRAHFVLARITYPGDLRGFLLYIKASLTGNESEFLKKYSAENPDFPHQSTANQLYSETQFEAYRALGEHIARDLFREDLIDGWQEPPSVRGWFEQLAKRL